MQRAILLGMHRTYELFRARGGLWVIAQMLLIPGMLAVLIWLRISGTELSWAQWLRTPAMIVGCLLLIAAAALLAAAVLHLGRSLTAFPRPLQSGTLIVHGAYALVRHPIYTAIILAMLGVAFVLPSAVGLAFAVVTFVFFDRKAAYEERMLTNVYSEYAEYRRRVRKLIPLLY
jgi:protein-S-isoprenylcysteine O-methyltransferase Ste14